MSPTPAAHATFVIEREFRAPLTRVFAAWANPEKKRRWFACHDDWKTLDHRLDFRIDGVEISEVAASDGSRHSFKARYLDIVPERRIVYAYDLRVDDVRISVSLVTVVFDGAGSKTKQVFTEQVVFLDGHGDVQERREGTELGFLRLDREV